MTVEEKVFALWLGDSSALQLVPMDRIKPWAANLQNVPIPYINHGLISETVRARTHAEGAAALRLQRWQFNVCAESTSQAQEILGHLVRVMDGVRDGFHFQHQGDLWLESVPEMGYVTYASEFLVAVPPA